jgi:hypothetical protein
MKIPGKKFVLVTAPLVAAAAMLGVPLAGSAHALQRQTTCQLLLQEANDYYQEGFTDFYYANEALAAGNWTDYLYYSYLEAKNDDMGNYVTGLANNRGC